MPQSSAVPDSGSRKLPAWLRWTDLLVRSGHLAAAILLGASVLGAPVGGGLPAACVVASGLAMLLVDTWQRPAHLFELAGATVLLKLALVAWMAADAGVRGVVFWAVVVISGVVSHAPSRIRHRPLLPGQRR